MIVFCGLALILIQMITGLNDYSVERITIDPVVTVKRIGVYSSVDSWKSELIENDRVRVSDKSLTTDVTLEMNSLHWHEIEDPVVDYVPAFELYW